MSVVVTPIGVKVCKMVEPCPRTIFSASVSDILGVIKCEVKKGARFGWTIFWLLRHRFLPCNREYLENGTSRRYTSIKA